MNTSNRISWEQAVEWLRSQPDQVDLVRACFFDPPLAIAAERYYKCSEWQAVKKLLPAGRGSALDVGAGMGIASYALARDGWQVSALEPDPSSIVGAGAIRQLAAETKLEIGVVETWGEQLPFGDSQFDVVHCRQVLHHARDLRALCREVGRVLKPGGVFLATREHVISRREDLNTFLNGHPLHRLYGGEHAYLLSEYLSAIRDAGIRVRKTFNPYESDINLFPESQGTLRGRIANRLHIKPWMVPNVVLAALGSRDSTPGRLFSFVGSRV